MKTNGLPSGATVFVTPEARNSLTRRPRPSSTRASGSERVAPLFLSVTCWTKYRPLRWAEPRVIANWLGHVGADDLLDCRGRTRVEVGRAEEGSAQAVRAERELRGVEGGGARGIDRHDGQRQAIVLEQDEAVVGGVPRRRRDLCRQRHELPGDGGAGRDRECGRGIRGGNLDHAGHIEFGCAGEVLDVDAGRDQDGRKSRCSFP